MSRAGCDKRGRPTEKRAGALIEEADYGDVPRRRQEKIGDRWNVGCVVSVLPGKCLAYFDSEKVEQSERKTISFV